MQRQLNIYFHKVNMDIECMCKYNIENIAAVCPRLL